MTCFVAVWVLGEGGCEGCSVMHMVLLRPKMNGEKLAVTPKVDKMALSFWAASGMHCSYYSPLIVMLFFVRYLCSSSILYLHYKM